VRSDHCRSAQGFSSHGTLNYVLSLEGDDWFESDRVATLAGIYMSNRADSSSLTQKRHRVVLLVWCLQQMLVVGLVSRLEMVVLVRLIRVEVMSPSRRCFVCNMPGHLAKDCPKRVSTSGYQPPQRGNFRGAGSYPHQIGSRGNRGGAQMKLCTANDPVRTVVLQDCGAQCGEERHWPHQNFVGIWGISHS